MNIDEMWERWLKQERMYLRIRVGLIAVAAAAGTLAFAINLYALWGHLCP